MKIFCFYLNKDDLQIKVNNGKIAYKQQENKTVSKKKKRKYPNNHNKIIKDENQQYQSNTLIIFLANFSLQKNFKLRRYSKKVARKAM